MTDKWRSIDIDALDPDSHLAPADLFPTSSVTPAQSHADITDISNQIRTQLSQGNFAAALQMALDTAPYASDDQTKETHARTVFETLCSIKNNNADVGVFVKSLSSEQRDTLIKYLYRCMGSTYGQKQGALLLNWFERCVDVVGVGSIARFLTDRRTV
ncbi:uncharacterized protein LODBEIA_P17520 [Lodderomyces beijingensis]|uniref:Actin-related protein 2/3 complex subunit 5 n=1 Tax=Lodderomyces beijingensis TaxID=1775926 RepID=A0ABP0ZH89_9ASCO